MSWMYAVGMSLSLLTLGFQIKAARGITACSTTLPYIWAAFATSCFLFALDKFGDWLYFTYFMLNSIIMFIAARIIWKKSST